MTVISSLSLVVQETTTTMPFGDLLVFVAAFSKEFCQNRVAPSLRHHHHHHHRYLLLLILLLLHLQQQHWMVAFSAAAVLVSGVDVAWLSLV